MLASTQSAKVMKILSWLLSCLAASLKLLNQASLVFENGGRLVMNHSAFCAGLVLADPAVREIWLVAGEAHGKISLVFVYVGGF